MHYLSAFVTNMLSGLALGAAAVAVAIGCQHIAEPARQAAASAWHGVEDGAAYDPGSTAGTNGAVYAAAAHVRIIALGK
jgi:hypothetical protein